MAEREHVIIARVKEKSNDVKFEIIKKVLPRDPKKILIDLDKQYGTPAAVTRLFEVEEPDLIQEIIGKEPLLEHIDLFKIESIYIYGFKKQDEWLHLWAKDKKLREASDFE